MLPAIPTDASGGRADVLEAIEPVSAPVEAAGVEAVQSAGARRAVERIEPAGVEAEPSR
jgi:hypothetical protein